MGRSRLARRAWFAIGAGLLGLPLVLLASCTDAGQETEAPRVVDFEPIAARTDTGSQTVTLQDVPIEPEDTPVEETSPEPPLRPGSSRAAAPTTGQPLTGFEPMAVRDLLTNRAITPVVFAELPVADTEAERAVSAIPLHVPGCVGSAKRYWVITDEGSNPAQSGNPGLVTHPCSGPGGAIPIRLRGLCANPERDAGLPAMCAGRNATDRGGSGSEPRSRS